MDATARAEVLDCERRLLDAMLASDADALDRLLHDDLLFNGPTGATATKAEDLANYRSGGIHLHTAAPGEYRTSQVGDCVVVAVTVHLAGDYMGQSLDGRARDLRVWLREGEAWRVVGGAVIPVARDT